MHVVVQQIREEPQASDPLSHAAPFSGHKQHRECLCTFPCLERMQQHDECERLLFCCLLVRSLLVPMQLSEPFSSSSATSTSHSNAPELHEHVYGQIRSRQRRFSGVVSYSTKSTLVYVPRTLCTHSLTEVCTHRGRYKNPDFSEYEKAFRNPSRERDPDIYSCAVM
jgi:hypothetical protein